MAPRICDFSVPIHKLSTALLLLAMAPTPVHADELKPGEAHPQLTNSGFLNPPPEALKKKFRMCDAFLRVEWLDKERRIGWSRYDFYIDGRKRGQMTALVFLGRDFPAFDYDLYEYQRQGELQSLICENGEDYGAKVSADHTQWDKVNSILPSQAYGVAFRLA